METMVFKILKDCDLIQKKTYTINYPDTEEGPFTLKVMPSGMAIAKFLNN